MTRVAVPIALSELIARKAVQNARQDLVKRNWKSASAIHPYSQAGKVGITSTVNYLLIQNRGFKPFVMWWVKNRTVPLGCPQGDGPHFRFGNPASVGEPGEVDIPHKGKVWRAKRWQHPGLTPKKFMETAISRAIKDSRKEIQKSVMDNLRGGA
jgi:hypothetical protein